MSEQAELLPQDNDEKSSRFQEGENITLVRVRFPGNAKSQAFLLGSRRFMYAQKVLAMSDRGMTVGYINSFPYTVGFKKEMLPLRTIAKYAEAADIEEQITHQTAEKKAEVLCLRLVEKHQLDMNLTHVEFMQFGKKAVFYFTAPARVDFRDLVKELVADLKMRIELRQISVRDRAAALGAIGPCGLQTCCSSFLQRYGNASIKMAKNQNLALIPSKINGVCGQIKCCIKYEDNVYSHKRGHLPEVGLFIKTANGDVGKVTRLHILIEQFEMMTVEGKIRRYAVGQFNPEDCTPPDSVDLTQRPTHIINETSTVIGLITTPATEFLEEVSDDEVAEEIIETQEEEEEEIIPAGYRYRERPTEKVEAFDQADPRKGKSNQRKKRRRNQNRRPPKGNS